jgi:hypothetical protein
LAATLALNRWLDANMISVILYGRNDSHGYNLHKRAAISINCIAEVLSHPDDEILFVDYNTPNDLPTFIEAIYDTLTVKAKSRLRVLRVRPELHARMVPQTHLFALEPHSRNIALRRSNPRNRWILSTNTDMIFVPRDNIASLSDAVDGLPDGQYIVPRFELPEPMWESFPRGDPQAVIRACEEFGPKLHLHEIAASFPYMRFDSPGDFQLAPRQALFDIHGFDERMIHGWHADSNLCKRLYLFYGNCTQSLDHRLTAYHCDHTRVATLAHRLDIKIENNPQEFVYGVQDAVAHHQAETWGVPGEPVEELDFANDPQARFVSALERTLGGAQSGAYLSDANDCRNFVYYRQEHALPYVAGNLTVYPRDARFAYVGNNPRMLHLTARCIAEMGFTQPLRYVRELLSAGTAPDMAQPIRAEDVPCGVSLHQYLLANHNLLIFDFGLDQTGLNLGAVARTTDWPRELRYSLGAVARCLEECAEQSDTLSSGQVPDFLVLNANHHVFGHFVRQFLIATDTPYPTHVRKGRPRMGQERVYKGTGWKYTEDFMRSWFAYGEENHSLGTIAPGDDIDLTAAGQSARYKDGDWGAMDFTGSWIEGTNAAIVFAPPAAFTDDLVAYVRINEAFLGPEGDPMRVQVFLEEELLDTWTVYTRYEVAVGRAVLPGRLLAGKTECRLEFHIENPQSAERFAKASGKEIVGEDPRELGVKIQKITFTGTNRLKYSLLDTLDFAENGEGAYYVNECWTQPDGLGIWSLGADASLTLLLHEPVETPLIATFTITDAAVSEQYPLQEVVVAVNGRSVAEWTIGPTRQTDERSILLPGGIPVLDPVQISFHILRPRSPGELQWGGDTRPLGFRLTKFKMGPAGSLKYRLGELIDLTDGGNSAAFVGDYRSTQWTLPDRFGSWTVGPVATMKVPFEEPPTVAMPASFVISDCMVSKLAPSLSVRVKANGRPVAEWQFTNREVHRRSIHLPAEVITGSEELILTFEIATPRSPASLGWASDSREFGMRLGRAVIGSDDVAIPTFGGPSAVRRGIVRRILGLPGFTLHVARLLVKRWSER